MNGFDFDEWAELYRRDPNEFERRRQAVMVIELAKGGAHAAPARQMLERLDHRLASLDDAQRASTAFVWMAASLSALGSRMAQLGEAVGEMERTLTQARAPAGSPASPAVTPPVSATSSSRMPAHESPSQRPASGLTSRRRTP